VFPRVLHPEPLPLSLIPSLGNNQDQARLQRCRKILHSSKNTSIYLYGRLFIVALYVSEDPLLEHIRSNNILSFADWSISSSITLQRAT
jgi:hypothetical protein